MGQIQHRPLVFVKFRWNTATPSCFHVADYSFPYNNRVEKLLETRMAHKAENIYCLPFTEKVRSPMFQRV